MIPTSARGDGGGERSGNGGRPEPGSIHASPASRRERLETALIIAAALLAALAMPPGGGQAAEQSAAAASPAAETAELRTAGCDELEWVIDSALSRAPLRGAEVALVVESLESGDVLCERNADLPMVPASNMKLVTAAAALSELGPDYRFLTTVTTDAPEIGSTLAGNLYVRGTGDPSFVTEELYKLAESIRVRGVDRIQGDIVLDASWFDSLAATSDLVAGGDRAYHARTGALSLNFNGLAVHVTPGDSHGEPAVVRLAPETSFVDVRNLASTRRRGARTALTVHRANENGRNVVTVEGSIAVGSGPHVAYRNIDDVPGYFGSSLVRFLAEAGVVVDGSVRSGRAPDEGLLVAEHRSKPLSLIIRDLNKYSNNFVAEQLLKALSASAFGPPGTTSGGIRVLEDFLVSAGADSTSWSISDGSGFSRANRLSPRALARVIRAALSDFRYKYEFAASLSVSGVDGTLEDRMGYPALRGLVRAKTGLLDGVTAISGIIEQEDGEELVVSLLVNGYGCEAWRVHDFEHSVLALLRSGLVSERGGR